MFFFTINPYSCFCSNPMRLTWSLSCGCSKNLFSVIRYYSLPLITAFDLEPLLFVGIIFAGISNALIKIWTRDTSITLGAQRFYNSQFLWLKNGRRTLWIKSRAPLSARRHSLATSVALESLAVDACTGPLHTTPFIGSSPRQSRGEERRQTAGMIKVEATNIINA